MLGLHKLKIYAARNIEQYRIRNNLFINTRVHARNARAHVIITHD